MILTSLKLHGKPSKQKEIVLALEELATRMKLDEDLVNAGIYQDLEDSDILYFLEEWQTIEDLNRHEKSQSSAVLNGLASLLVAPPEIVKAETIQLPGTCLSMKRV